VYEFDVYSVFIGPVKREFSPLAVILFGSYINGTPNENSNIDIGILFNGFSGD
jgi:predicted nucleotidyltransferase